MTHNSAKFGKMGLFEANPALGIVHLKVSGFYLPVPERSGFQ
jgi:hypothetical protein